MRTLAVVLATVFVGCASAGTGPRELGRGGGSCEDSCRAASDQCTDNSGRREPDGTTCAEDLRACLAWCPGSRAGPPAVRIMTGREIFLISLLNLFFGGLR
jgi:hypothetical protein